MRHKYGDESEVQVDHRSSVSRTARIREVKTLSALSNVERSLIDSCIAEHREQCKLAQAGKRESMSCAAAVWMKAVRAGANSHRISSDLIYKLMRK